MFLKNIMIEIRGDEYAKKLVPEIERASEEDFITEYLDYIISIKVLIQSKTL